MVGSNLDFGIKPLKFELDVRFPKSIEKACIKYSPSGILCLSSINIRDSEHNSSNAYKVNVIGVHNLAREARKRQIPLILISTGAIFSGSIEEIFSEDSIPNPLNIYGQTKYTAEIIALKSSAKNLVIRTGWIFGSGTEKKRRF